MDDQVIVADGLDTTVSWRSEGRIGDADETNFLDFQDSERRVGLMLDGFVARKLLVFLQEFLDARPWLEAEGE